MATVKVFDAKGVKEIQCFQTLDNIPYIENVEEVDGLLPDFEIEQKE